MINYENGIANRGNWDRMKRLMKRAEAGEKLTIAFIGGSITMGALSSTPQQCYAYHVYEWWRMTFPKAEFTYINAGIGATDSQSGCARVEADLLRYQPDFVIVEFSVNDESTGHYLETYEGLVRAVYGAECHPAVMLVHNVYYHNGANAQVMHAKVARYYEIPAVSMQSSIYPEVVAGRIEAGEITPDDLHPNEAGHTLVASVITYMLDKIRMAEGEEPPAPALKSAFTRNEYEQSVRYQNDNCTVKIEGFAADATLQHGITDVFKNGWTASGKGAAIEFEVTGSCIGVQYRKTIQKPAPVAEVVIDDDEAHAKILDANFDEEWGDKLQLDTVAEHIEKKMHKVRITLKETHEDDRLPFYLVSVIAS